jgi:hypothetical protein
MVIICRHITTLLNYRIRFSGRSDFWRIYVFPEVYHGQGISEALFSAAARRVTERGGTQHMEEKQLTEWHMLCFAPLRAVGKKEDPELAFFGSQQKKRELCIGLTYPYAPHLHS